MEGERSQGATATATARFLADRAQHLAPTRKADTVRTVLSASTAESMRRLGRDTQTSLVVLLETALAIVSSRWTETHDVVVGTSASDGAEHGIQDTLASSARMIALRFHIDPRSSVEDILQEAHTTCMRAFADQGCTFESIEQEQRVSIGFTMDAQAMTVLAMCREHLPIPVCLSQLDLVLCVRQQADEPELEGVFHYDQALFNKTSIEQFAAQWQRLLVAMVDDPSRRLGDLESMAVEERRSLLAAGDRTAERASFTSVSELIATRGEQCPDAVALEFGADRLTYRELGHLTNHLAEKVRQYDVRRGDVVAVAIERSVELVVSQLAVLTLGAVLLPVDVEQPPRRVDAMLSDAHAQLVLAGDSGAIGLGNLLPVLDVVTELTNTPTCPGTYQPVVDIVGPQDSAYTVYTSGSTGRPKGAVNTQAGIANRIAWMQDTYRLTPDDRVLYKTPVAFDVAMWEWLWPLTAGARVIIAEPGIHRDPAALARSISTHAVTVIHFIPSMLRLFAAQSEAQDCGSSLRQIVCSGEELTAVIVKEALRICASVDNLYGPTEAAIDVTSWVCGPDERRVPIGRAISGVRLRVVDENLGLVPVGVPGELLIGGVALARGYASRPGLTSQAFIADPWGSGERLYRTGDRVRWCEPGVLEFLGRFDAQVKIRGVRVEPGEVERVLGTYPGVTESAVVVHTDERRGTHLVAFVCGAPASADLRGHLRRALPEAMVPAVFHQLKSLPRTASGKIDRTVLTSNPLVAASAGN
ncbi:non-ribosomal peptide synthetase [Nocardia fluminea]|uniref:non-ribosomal peptide synthetase n=1 Tax=Nocardia fluminea TaxID=134984 RepID=UPI00364E2D68